MRFRLLFMRKRDENALAVPCDAGGDAWIADLRANIQFENEIYCSTRPCVCAPFVEVSWGKMQQPSFRRTSEDLLKRNETASRSGHCASENDHLFLLRFLRNILWKGIKRHPENCTQRSRITISILVIELIARDLCLMPLDDPFVVVH